MDVSVGQKERHAYPPCETHTGCRVRKFNSFCREKKKRESKEKKKTEIRQKKRRPIPSKHEKDPGKQLDQIQLISTGGGQGALNGLLTGEVVKNNR